MKNNIKNAPRQENEYSGCSILIVDDIPENLQVLGNILYPEKMDLRFATNGQQALDSVHYSNPDLILLDVMMPVMDGFEVCKLLKSQAATKHIPIIFLTAKTDQVDINRGLDLGACDYITKPFNAQEMMLRVRTHLNLKIARDIISSQNNQLQENIKALKHAKEKAEKASQAKAMFLSNMSHELRTPLNAVIGLTNILAQDNPRDDQLGNLNTLKFSAENLISIINDILDFNKIEAGKVLFEDIDFNIPDLLDSIMLTFRVNARKKGIKLILNMDKSIPDIVVGDKARLVQIISNLLSNAIKFTDNGHVRLDIKKIKEKNGSVKIYFAVEDTGMGISKKKQGLIFQDFVQAEADTTRVFGGTGLGLAIVKRLLELQNSKITVKSEVGKGSVFSFTLDFRIGADQKLKKQDSNKKVEIVSLKGTKVLLAEDNTINVIVAKQFLHKWEVACDVVQNGKDAIKYVKNNNYHMVLMDLQMPIMDGYDATRAIRNLENPEKSKIPIIAVTATGLNEVKQKVAETGMDGFITKPFNPDQLYLAISGHIEKQGYSA